MAASPIVGDISKLEFVYIVMYQLRTMSDDEKREWFKEWARIRKRMPKGIKIVTEAGSAFGTDFTGFTVFEGPFEQYEQLVTVLEEKSGLLFEKTRTIIGTKGIADTPSEVQKILERRPID